MNVVFWNINKRDDVYDVVADMIVENQSDIAAIAEVKNDEEAQSLLTAIVSKVPTYKLQTPQNKWKKNFVYVYYRSDVVEINDQFDSSDIHVKRINLVNQKDEIYGIFCHQGSKMSNNDNEQTDSAETLVKHIRDFEKLEVEYNRMFVCGDFNMNPFEEGLIKAKAFHAVNSKTLLNKDSRTIDGENYPIFYNPMWSFFGDNSKGITPGTYYYSGSKQREYFWHIFDQVLLRPSIIDMFEEDKLDILTSIKGISMLKNGVIDKSIYSDHLPIVFTFKL